jgi:hypothetical protein
MQKILLVISLGFLAGAGACSPKAEETGKAVDCHVLILEGRDTMWIRARGGDTLYSTLRPALGAADTLHPVRAPRPDLTQCLLADTIHRP